MFFLILQGKKEIFSYIKSQKEYYSPKNHFAKPYPARPLNIVQNAGRFLIFRMICVQIPILVAFPARENAKLDFALDHLSNLALHSGSGC